jgi:hypothetical protein
MMYRMVALMSCLYQWRIYGGLMALTLEELKGRLKQLDEVILVDVLQLESEDIVNRFEDVIERNFYNLEMQLEEPYRYDSYD